MTDEQNRGEERSILGRDQPQTVDSLAADLRAVGVTKGMTLLVHSSLSAIGWVSGGPVAVILALEEALGPSGTLVMPAHSGGLSDPAGWSNPPVPQAWWETIRDTMPAFVADLTPTRRVGTIPETFRKQAGVLRSHHPTVSFCAWGRNADMVTRDHSLAFSLGEGSPLARIYDLDGSILLLGVGHANNTSLHLSENRASHPGRRVVLEGSPLMVDGERRWQRYEDVNFDDSDFPEVGAAFDAAMGLTPGRIGHAESRLMSQRALVDFGTAWITANRAARPER